MDIEAAMAAAAAAVDVEVQPGLEVEGPERRAVTRAVTPRERILSVVGEGEKGVEGGFGGSGGRLGLSGAPGLR